MIDSILALDSNVLIWIIIAVVLVLMIVMTIVPQKKRQKEQQNMMNSLAVGTKIMTIGRMVGKITQVNSDNTLIVNVGTENSPTLIVIDRQAVGLVLEAVQAPAAAPAPAVEEPAPAPAVEEKAPETEEPKEEIKAEEAPAIDGQVEEAPAAEETKAE